MVGDVAAKAACGATSEGTATDGGETIAQAVCTRLVAAGCPRAPTLAACLEAFALQRAGCQSAGLGAAFDADLRCGATATFACDINGNADAPACQASSFDVRLCTPATDGGVGD